VLTTETETALYCTVCKIQQLRSYKKQMKLVEHVPKNITEPNELVVYKH